MVLFYSSYNMHPPSPKDEQALHHSVSFHWRRGAVKEVGPVLRQRSFRRSKWIPVTLCASFEQSATLKDTLPWVGNQGCRALQAGLAAVPLLPKEPVRCESRGETEELALFPPAATSRAFLSPPGSNSGLPHSSPCTHFPIPSPSLCVRIICW